MVQKEEKTKTKNASEEREKIINIFYKEPVSYGI